MSMHWKYLNHEEFKGSGRCRPEKSSVVPGATIPLVVLINFEYCPFKFQPDWILLIMPTVQERTSEVKFSLVVGKYILIYLKIQDRNIVSLYILRTTAWEHFCCQKLISTWSYHVLLDYKLERIIQLAHGNGGL